MNTQHTGVGLRSWIAALVAIAHLYACSAPSTADGSTPTDATIEGGTSFSATIGPEGGELTAGSYGMTLYIPPNIVAQPTTFTVRVAEPSRYPTPGELLGPVFEFGPDGFDFVREVRLSATPSRRPGDGEEAVLAVLDTAQNRWVPLERSYESGNVATGDNRVIGRTTHFSAYTTIKTTSFAHPQCRMLQRDPGINTANSLTITGATPVRRTAFGGLEWSSEWIATAPMITISGRAVLDGRGQWAAWRAGGTLAGMPRPSPVGFAITGRQWSITVDWRALAASGHVALSIDEFCQGDYDIGIVCGPGCSGAATDAGVDATADARPPVRCAAGSAALTAPPPTSMVVAGNTLIGVHNGTTDALQTFDVRAPTTPAPLATRPLLTNAPRQVAARGSTVFVTDGPRLVAFDVSNPSSPTELGAYNFDTDATLRAALGNPGTRIDAMGVAVTATHVVAATTHRGLVVIDASNPSAMTRVGHSNAGTTSPRMVAVQGSRAYVLANENRICAPPPCNPPELRGAVIFDVSNAAMPQRLGVYSVTNVVPVSLAIEGNYLYLTATNSQYFVADVSNPAAPIQRGSVETNGSANSIAVASGKLFLASNNNDPHIQVYSLATPMALPVRFVDDILAPTGGGLAFAAGATHGYVASAGRLFVIDLACP